MIDPISIVANVASSMSAALALTSFGLAMKNTPPDVATCLRLITRVSDDLGHLIRLRNRTVELGLLPLNRFPQRYPSTNSNADTDADLTRIDSIITSTATSIASVGILVEACRIDPTRFANRARWVLAQAASFNLRSRELHAQQTAVVAEIAFLRQLEANASFVRSTDASTVSTGWGRGLSRSRSFENLELLRDWAGGGDVRYVGARGGQQGPLYDEEDGGDSFKEVVVEDGLVPPPYFEHYVEPVFPASPAPPASVQNPFCISDGGHLLVDNTIPPARSKSAMGARASSGFEGSCYEHPSSPFLDTARRSVRTNDDAEEAFFRDLEVQAEQAEERRRQRQWQRHNIGVSG